MLNTKNVSKNDISQLKELKWWLDDNVEQGTDITFGTIDGNDVTSECLLPIVDALLLELEERQTFVIVGRVSDEDNVMLFINSIDSDQAKHLFIECIKVEQDWDCERDIYIEFCISLSDFQKNHIYTNVETADRFCGSSS
ncbi:hypothetical protein [Pseudoalteromonas luteoviolacea]|uniref:Uncharacterized protein n=1 Tax=Pseudoalteromonas luteoviolacea S4060-1 TaxID=1365257 RepID=A0A161YNF5_9GAMM|nr:hypothetical protein [Pseudoalteromonas luteoviolacea]KZN63319.1 hypothetical protein N478_03455 [Pseudoalteromonas luteoviolacea S4060-1]